MNKKEMFDLLENMTDGMNGSDLAYANLRIEDLRKKFEKVDENKWNETMEKHGENKIIGSAIDYVFDGTELTTKVEREYKSQIEKSRKVRAKIESRKDFESRRAYWKA